MNKMAPRTSKGKRKNESGIQQEISDALHLFVDAPPDDDKEIIISNATDDSSDSECSVNSLENEENDDFEEDASSEESKSESENEENSTEEDHSSRRETNVVSSSREEINKTPISKPLSNEYEYDSSDEEDLRNTIGNIPVEWYNDYPHIGYDWDGKAIMKPATKDELDKFLSKMEDPDFWRTVHDKQTGKDVVLSDEDLDIILKLQRGSYPSKDFNPYKPWVDIYSHEVEIHPMTNRPEHKRSFYPSKIEKQKVSKMLHAIRMGWIQPRKQKEEGPRFYPLWDDDNEKAAITKRHLHHIPAPKLKLPGHEESYNPPPEYLFSKEEEEEWLSKDPEDRKLNFIPKIYSRLLDVPAYPQFVQERFDRCLDLYLCPRQQKMRMNVDPEDLIPKLPKPKDLQPFPTTLSIVYRGHSDLIRCLTVESFGQFLATGSDDNSIKVWEIATGRCLKTICVDGPVKSIAWCPNNSVCLLAAAVNNNTFIINPGVGDKLIVSNTNAALAAPLENKDEKKPIVVKWNIADENKQEHGIHLILSHPKEVKQITWHAQGDYFATVMADAGNSAVQVHQLTKRRSQQPFSRTKGLVQCVCFHPRKPYFFVATQRYIRIYNLLKQELTKKLMTNSKWVSSMAIHPAGDNVIIGGYDNRLSWFDLDLSTKPYQTLRHHKQAIRQVAFHKRYPLFASASDDCSVIVCHGMVYNDLLQNPLIVPVKVLKGHAKKDDLGVIDCVFHPNQPWIFSAGADGTARLYT